MLFTTQFCTKGQKQLIVIFSIIHRFSGCTPKYGLAESLTRYDPQKCLVSSCSVPMEIKT